MTSINQYIVMQRRPKPRWPEDDYQVVGGEPLDTIQEANALAEKTMKETGKICYVQVVAGNALIDSLTKGHFAYVLADGRNVWP